MNDPKCLPFPGLIRLPSVVMAFFLCALPLSEAMAQQDNFERSLSTFDQRAEDVRGVVDSSRIPEANSLFEEAVRTRDQAEKAYRQGNLQVAKSLLDRALALLVQAENVARGGGIGDAEIRRLRNLLSSLRQSLQDSKRWLHDLEVNNRETDVPSSARSFLAEQKDRTEEIVKRAEDLCADTVSDRCQELLARARKLLEQADNLLPSALEPVSSNSPMVENRLQDARQFLDKAQSELDAIQRELQGDQPPNQSSLSRIRNIENLIRYGNDRLQEADVQTDNLRQGQSTTVLSLLRRANELAHLALRSLEGNDRVIQEYQEREARVDSIRNQVEEMQGTDGTSFPQYNQGIEFQSQAAEQAAAGNYELALQLLSQAATYFNNALAQAGTESGAVNSDSVYNDLKGKFERDYSATVGSGPSDTNTREGCAEKLQRARNQADQSMAAYDNGNIQLALYWINQAQQSLNEAKTCLGQSTQRIVDVLNRLQTQFDKRLPTLEDSLEGVDEAGKSSLTEAKSLRDLSDAQEASGNYEQAVQTVGRAIKNLGTLQQLAGDRSSQSDGDLLASIQGKYDERIDRVRSLVESKGDSSAIALLEEADKLRQRSENAAESGNPRLGLAFMGQAISLLERAALGS
ncbi:MAG: hypothetical protein KC978_10695 [Candidatus Omnitrophica bacterium]|nr:hypothetical protein [Candidatus Omnitrophota bacterium]